MPAPSPPPTRGGNGRSPGDFGGRSGAHLPDSQVATVSVVLGLQEEPPEGGAGRKLGKPLLQQGFDFSYASAQAAVLRLCEEIEVLGEELSVRRADCFTKDFQVFLDTQRRPGFPVVPGADVHVLLKAFLVQYIGKQWIDHVGFSDGPEPVVTWVKMDFKTNLASNMAAEDAWVWAERWDEFIESRSAVERGSHIGGIFHTSDLWVRAETERLLVKTTLICAVCSICFALLTVLIFLRNLALAVYLILSIICVVLCLAALMFAGLGWPFGAVEAVGLIVFVGFSVDYSLHLAESFNQSTGNTRFYKAQEALRRTGGAVSAAAITSALAGLPILLCKIQVFVKFGLTVVFNTGLSLVFSLGFFMSVLMIIGPVDSFGPCDIILVTLGLKKYDVEDNFPPVVAVSSANEVQGTVVGVSDGRASPREDSQASRPPAGGYSWSSYDANPETEKKGGVAPEAIDDDTLAQGSDSSTAPTRMEATRVSTPTRESSSSVATASTPKCEDSSAIGDSVGAEASVGAERAPDGDPRVIGRTVALEL